MTHPAPSATQARYQLRRSQIETYFDRTAVEAWARLTSTEPVGGVRATVRAGRDRMRAALLDCLPQDLHGHRLLDAGCGTGALAVEAARRGAEVVAVDLSPKLVQLARERSPTDLGSGSIRFLSGDMLDPALGSFDHVVSMDALIHYDAQTVVRVLGDLAKRTRHSMVFTFAPGTPLLMAMMAVGRLFPKGNRSPSIHPVPERTLRRLVGDAPALAGWHCGRTARVASGFYQSQALELHREQAA
jgi:magnesium-protoporphyrin O-methyltransferase